LNAIGVRDIDGYKSEQLQKGMSPKSVNNQLTVLRKCLFVAVEWALLAHVPAVKWLKTGRAGLRLSELRGGLALSRGGEARAGVVRDDAHGDADGPAHR
jgi:hypothetical protein